MFVERKINNNVILANNDGKHMIVMGKGIGFNVYPKDKVKKNLIERTFIPKEESDINYMVDILKEIPMEVLNAAKFIVNLGENQIKNELSPNLVVTLSDHINMALNRFHEGINLKHPLEWEITQFYSQEMRIAEEAWSIVNQHLHSSLPKSEIPFLAMHFVNAQISSANSNLSKELIEVIVQIVNIIKYHFQININEQTTTFSRFVTHLRYYLIRQLNSENDYSVLDNELVDIVKEKYSKAYVCSERIAAYLVENYGSQSSENEIVYLTLHINRLVKENQ
ncbi:PRD domain-containing protein [Oceanobacillus sojae]|uniref:PRD domain-containing protein n=1 Tax=Oceanobacillus sojae TaxID=582851 RepID=UPI0021A63B7C|nr:PRD domain-containing protein [Oceanobacillus sojae]MCT1901994.1 PRD domain-containing protein [Oceanobacillus sojae]